MIYQKGLCPYLTETVSSIWKACSRDRKWRKLYGHKRYSESLLSMSLGQYSSLSLRFKFSEPHSTVTMKLCHLEVVLYSFSFQQNYFCSRDWNELSNKRDFFIHISKAMWLWFSTLYRARALCAVFRNYTLSIRSIFDQ